MDPGFNVWKWEMESCCCMNLEDLYKQLSELYEKGKTIDISISPDFKAAPHDETLFDGVVLLVKSTDEGKIEVNGVVYYWHATDGGWHENTVIRTFEKIEDCLQWLKNDDYAASKECSDILYERCK